MLVRVANVFHDEDDSLQGGEEAWIENDDDIAANGDTTNVSNLLDRANAVANNSRAKSTIKSYERAISRMRVFAAQDDSTWDVGIFDNPPLPDQFFKEFLGKES